MLSLQKILSRTKKYSPGCIYNKKIMGYMCETLDRAVDRNYSEFVPESLLVDEEDKQKYHVDEKVRELSKKIIHNDYLVQKTLLYNRNKNEMILKRLKNKTKAIRQEEHMNTKPESLALKYLRDFKENPTESKEGEKLIEEKEFSEKDETVDNDKPVSMPIHMPYAATDSYEKVENIQKEEYQQISDLNEEYINLYENHLEAEKAKDSSKISTIVEKKKSHNEYSNFKPPENTANIPPDWMTNYEQYNEFGEGSSEKQLYGTPNKHVPVSSIPCGGCGALLHCQDNALPGYLPSELFVNQENSILRNSLCQRCHFMKYYKTTLDVTVSPEDYADLLVHIKYQKAAVILMVDLTDFPCSIWPGIKDIIEKKTPIFLVGNKVDLLPNDGPRFLENVENSLVQAVIGMGVKKTNIKCVSLISAKTGYGVESLINRLHKLWEYRGDVYLVGCTNVGKSSLFNALLRSDYCKVQASDLIRRATISPWPGTTLNLLKFPILNPVRKRLWKRTQRLIAEREGVEDVSQYRIDKFKETNKIKFAALQGYIGNTFSSRLEANDDGYIAQMTPGTLEETGRLGLDENDKLYKQSRWCYDTPGAILPDQVLHLLTTPELINTLPQGIISPRSYILYEKQSLFIAGLGRLDLLGGDDLIICTVFAAHALPVTICETNDADALYKALLETEVLVVPTNDPERLKLFPPLESKSFQITGNGNRQSSGDVVLSSAGWVAVTVNRTETVDVQAWTPQGRGIHLRTPAMLSRSVNLKGYRIPKTQVFTRGKRVYTKH